ncbi:Gfo/Idh/MocA family oxidoreductase [Rhodococcus sp. G-MC3]|uniref:Gfo/Idh/MocA family protein n=1 Tax=Rhodococcus sp. G-MC3 TaxID=3046209 RepID=UPI0024BB6873|nr:Gfo/Idh/MocA family oxidoreductase [Rhodococcus sp. G-MC3]MDJ0395942.1 Gfo/Idh/MocA family oxidoreductase [Rhodococcus sp. G-MC3]
MNSTQSIRIGVAGFGWMGSVHTQAYARLRHHYPELGLVPVLASVADEVPGRAEQAAAQFGFENATTDWHDIEADSEIAAVSITAPNFLHRSIGTAMVEAGKHIWIEKPVGLSADDARAVAVAADKAGVQTAVGFNYRNAPAVEEAKALIESGDIGTVTHARFRFFSDYAAHPDGALSWRFERARGGNGVLGDLASHGADLLWYLLGEIDSLVADTAVFVPQRARPTGSTSGHALATGGELGPVENEDFVSSQIRLASGARATLEASRVSVGEQNAYGFEIHGTKGAVFWDFRRLGELGVSVGNRYQDQPVSTIFVGPGQGEYGAFQPGSASAMGYDDLKVIEAKRFLQSIAEGKPVGATAWDAVRSAEVLDAMTRSVESGSWVKPGAS